MQALNLCVRENVPDSFAPPIWINRFENMLKAITVALISGAPVSGVFVEINTPVNPQGARPMYVRQLNYAFPLVE